MSEQKKKKQHFVPVTLLQGFCSEQGLLDIYNSDIMEFHLSSRPNSFFYQKYMYQRGSNEFEDFMSNQVEGPTGTILKQLIAGDLQNLSNKNILKFIMSLEARTPMYLRRVKEFINSFGSQVAKDLAIKNNLDISDNELPTFSLGNSDSEGQLLVNSVGKSIIFSKAFEYLKHHILINETPISFIVSDNPVVRYNWYYMSSNDPRSTGMCAIGIMYMMPISPKHCLVLYDPEVYLLGGKHQHNFTIIKKSDVLFLNKMQAISSKYLLATSSGSEFMRKHLSCMSRYSKDDFFKVTSFSLNHTHEENRSLIGTNRYFVPFQEHPEFFRIKKKLLKNRLNFVEKDNEMLKACEEFLRDINFEK